MAENIIVKEGVSYYQACKDFALDEARLGVGNPEFRLKEEEAQVPHPWKGIEQGDNRVVCAAQKFPDGTIVLGVRHYDEFVHRTLELINRHTTDSKEQAKVIQGFVDRFGNFLTREEAWVVAFNAGQIIRRCGGDNGKLFSENLY
jgi:hypothetical protein